MILEKKISKYSDDTYKDVLNHLLSYFKAEIYNHEELVSINDYTEVKVLFFHFVMSNKGYNQSYYDEYIDLKYSETMVDMFLEMKNICESYTVNLLDCKNGYDLLSFVMDNFCIQSDCNQHEIIDYENIENEIVFE